MFEIWKWETRAASKSKSNAEGPAGQMLPGGKLHMHFSVVDVGTAGPGVIVWCCAPQPTDMLWQLAPWVSWRSNWPFMVSCQAWSTEYKTAGNKTRVLRLPAPGAGASLQVPWAGH